MPGQRFCSTCGSAFDTLGEYLAHTDTCLLLTGEDEWTDEITTANTDDCFACPNVGCIRTFPRAWNALRHSDINCAFRRSVPVQLVLTTQNARLPTSSNDIEPPNLGEENNDLSMDLMIPDDFTAPALIGTTELLEKHVQQLRELELIDIRPTASQLDEVNYQHLLDEHNLSDGTGEAILTWVRTCHGNPCDVRFPKAIRQDAECMAPKSDILSHSWSQSFGDETQEYTCQWRSLTGLIPELLDSCKDPENHFKFQYEYEGSYNNPNSGLRWRRTQEQAFGPNPKETESILGINLFDDESFQGNRGFLKVAAVGISLANFTTDYLQTRESKRVLLYKPKIKLGSKDLKSPRGRDYKMCFDEHCFSGVIAELNHFRHELLRINFHEKARDFSLYLHMLPTDNKQGNIASHVYDSWNCKRACRMCLKRTFSFGQRPFLSPVRKVSATKQLYRASDPIVLQDMSLQTFPSPWLDVSFGHSNDQGVFGSTPPEDLHTIDLGVMKKYAQWTRDAVNAQGSAKAVLLDKRIRKLNPFFFRRQGSSLPLKRRLEGLPSLETLPGTEYPTIVLLLIFAIGESDEVLPSPERRHILRSLLAVLQLRYIIRSPSLTAEEVSHLEDQLEYFMELFHKSFKDYSPTATDFPKLHYLFHFPQLIREYGSGLNFSGAPWESFLIDAVKRPAIRTQRHASTFAADLMRRIRSLRVNRIRYDVIHRLWKKYFPVQVHPSDSASASSSSTIQPRYKLSGRKYNIGRTASSLELLRAITSDSNISSARENDQSDANFLLQASTNGQIECHETLTVSPELGSEKIILHCQRQGTPDRRRDWVLIDWGINGIHPARVEAIFKKKNSGDDIHFIAVTSLDVPAPLDGRSVVIPFERRKLSEQIHVLHPSSISAEAVVILDVDSNGCFWVIPDYPEWPDVMRKD